MNLAEFPLSVVGKRAPGNAKTLHFQDEVWDRSKKAYVPRKLTITGSDLLGLPTSLDDEVLLGCVQLTKESDFGNRKVRFTRYELMERIGWKQDGKNYRRISESLDRWAGTLIISDKAFWDKAGQCWVKDSFNILDRVILSDRESGDGPGNKRRRSSFIWGDFMWKSFQAGNLKELDFDFWLSLNSPVAKRLYRLLDKRFYNRKVVTFDLHRLAQEKVGLSRKMHTGQIKEKLKPAHEELNERGVCRTEYVKRGSGKWDVVYGDIRQQKELPAPSENEQTLVEQLAVRGVKNGSELVDNCSMERILEAIENFDDRVAHGEDIGPGWLGKAIIHQDGFAFRKGYRSREEIELAVRAKQEEKAKRVIEEREFESELKREREAMEKTRSLFAAYVDGLSEEDCNRLEMEAIAKAHEAGKAILADHVQELRRRGERVTESGALRQQLWWDFVLTDEEKANASTAVVDKKVANA
ncbi:Replication initiator protein A [Crateriforma conspicua]|nr:Replication initiator protein A [Crateriforma conspicua]